jgi:hypothetical protein
MTTGNKIPSAKAKLQLMFCVPWLVVIAKILSRNQFNPKHVLGNLFQLATISKDTTSSLFKSFISGELCFRFKKSVFYCSFQLL